MNDRVVIVISTCPPSKAEEIASFLVESRLAACVNIVPGLTSIYRWREKVEREQECLLVIKCAAAQLDRLTSALVASHPYEVPEVIALPVDRVHPPYLKWILESTREAP